MCTDLRVSFQINVLEPHPHFPILATSGLDHDVKIWAPTAREATDLDGLKDVMKRNRKERREERIHMEPDMVDGQMLWLLMQHLRRSSRRNVSRLSPNFNGHCFVKPH